MSRLFLVAGPLLGGLAVAAGAFGAHGLKSLLEASGQAIAVRPEPQPGLARLERDPAILNGLYRSGYADAKTLAPRIREALVR